MARQLFVALGIGLAALFASCADTQRLATIEKSAAELQNQVKSLQAQVKDLEEQRSMEELFKNLGTVAYLTPGGDGYSAVESDIGRLTVMLTDIAPYANGSRVTLRFGNLLSATINGAKAKLEWGSVDAKGAPRNDAARSREVAFDESLRAGAWTNVRVVLEGIPPSDLGFVRVRDLTHTGITLNR